MWSCNWWFKMFELFSGPNQRPKESKMAIEICRFSLYLIGISTQQNNSPWTFFSLFLKHKVPKEGTIDGY